MQQAPTSTEQKDSLSSLSKALHHPSSEYRTVFESLVISTFILIAIVSILLFISYFFAHNTHVINRVILCTASLIYLAIAYSVWAHGKLAIASRLLITFYFVIASIILLGWGVNTPFGLLVFAVAIILSGILLGAKHTLYTASLAIASLLAIQTYITVNGTALFSDIKAPSHFGDAIAYGTLLAIFALITWLFGRQTERLLFKNHLAESALLKEKELLEIRVRERTQQLRKAQLDEMEQLYQFAEVGQLSTALLHDLSNHLSILNFDIADLKKHQHTQTVKHVEESTAYLEQMIAQVRKQLRGKNEKSWFRIKSALQEGIKIIAPKASDANAAITLKASKNLPKLYGDPLRLSHIVNILIQNAIEAYKPTQPNKTITVSITQKELTIEIRVIDHGNGISPAERNQLFIPHHSSKKDGLGIGLYIARKIAETHFKGALILEDTTDQTEFALILPKNQQ